MKCESCRLKDVKMRNESGRKNVRKSIKQQQHHQWYTQTHADTHTHAHVNTNQKLRQRVSPEEAHEARWSSCSSDFDDERCDHQKKKMERVIGNTERIKN